MQRIFIVSTMGGMDIWGVYTSQDLADKAVAEAKRMHWNKHAVWSILPTNLDPVITNDNDNPEFYRRPIDRSKESKASRHKP